MRLLENPLWNEKRIHPTEDALLLIDLQPDFMPGGALPVTQGHEIVPLIRQILPFFSTIVATQDWHPPKHISFASRHLQAPFSQYGLYGEPNILWPDHCIQGTPGAALHPGIPPEPLSLLLRKGMHPDVDSYSAFRENTGPDQQRKSTGLGALFHARNIRRIFLCGLARDYCVRYSAEDAAAEGFLPIILEDLCRSVHPEPNHVQAVSMALTKAGVLCAQSADFFMGKNL